MTTKNDSRTVGLKAVAALAMGLAANGASALDFSALYVFGDSLSDTGNIQATTTFPQAPYYNGRFSDGPNWVDGLADQLSLSSLHSLAGGGNYAWGGAETGPANFGFPPSLIDQTGFYFNDTGGTADSDALYVIWGGGNDVRNNRSGPAASNIVGIIGDLAAAGARNFLVPNLPDIGQTPESLGGMAPGGDAALMTQLTLDHNAALADGLANLSLLDPELNIVSLDVFAIFNAVIGDPGAYGITNWTDVCYDGGLDGSGTVCANPSEYVFWDGVHPTGYTHSVLADAAYAALAAPIPVPAALPLLLSALGVMGIAARRRRAA